MVELENKELDDATVSELVQGVVRVEVLGDKLNDFVRQVVVAHQQQLHNHCNVLLAQKQLLAQRQRVHLFVFAQVHDQIDQAEGDQRNIDVHVVLMEIACVFDCIQCVIH